MLHCRPIEIPFGDKDQRGDYTLQVEDMVEFNIATDRRDKLQRATNIILVEDTFLVNGEVRQKVGSGGPRHVVGGFAWLVVMYRALLVEVTSTERLIDRE